MKKKDLILKWLDHEPLSEKESKAFKKLGASDSFIKISETSRFFSAPAYDVEENLHDLLVTIEDHKEAMRTQASNNYRLWILRIAAVLIVAFGFFFYFFNSSQTIIKTAASEKTMIYLPDQSQVSLNASSFISYNKSDWKNHRKLELNGEAYFKVAKGKKFDVNTAPGIISVLGTQFNVEVRDNYFDVSCYEGMVRVTYDEKDFTLSAGKKLVVINEQVKQVAFSSKVPDWTTNRSTFKSMPFHFVIKEFERQYNIEVITKNIDHNTLFTGNFVHSDFETALQAISIPMRLKSKRDNNLLTLYRE